MVIINKKTNHVYENVSKTLASSIVGVSRKTIIQWSKKRHDDGTFLEVYNHFEIYFKTIPTSIKQGGIGRPFEKRS